MKMTTVAAKARTGIATATARVIRRSGSPGHSESTMQPSRGRPRTIQARTEMSSAAA